MKIENAAPFLAAGSGLKEITISGHSVVVELKNGSTLTVSAVTEEGEFSHYDLDMLTGREHKIIQKKREKIQELMKEIELTKTGGASNEEFEGLDEMDPTDQLTGELDSDQLNASSEKEDSDQLDVEPGSVQIDSSSENFEENK